MILDYPGPKHHHVSLQEKGRGKFHTHGKEGHVPMVAETGVMQPLAKEH